MYAVTNSRSTFIFIHECKRITLSSNIAKEDFSYGVELTGSVPHMQSSHLNHGMIYFDYVSIVNHGSM